MAHFPPNDTEQHCESLKKTGLVGKHEAKTLRTYNYDQLETALRGSTVPWLLNIQVHPVFPRSLKCCAAKWEATAYPAWGHLESERSCPRGRCSYWRWLTPAPEPSQHELRRCLEAEGPPGPGGCQSPLKYSAFSVRENPPCRGKSRCFSESESESVLGWQRLIRTPLQTARLHVNGRVFWGIDIWLGLITKPGVCWGRFLFFKRMFLKKKKVPQVIFHSIEMRKVHFWHWRLKINSLSEVCTIRP